MSRRCASAPTCAWRTSTSVDLAGPIKTVTVGDETYQARAVILAMGAAARHLGVPGEDELLGHGREHVCHL